MIDHLIGHEILNKMLYFLKDYYFQIFKKVYEKNVRNKIQ